ncbi:hypothetical protein H7F37_03585 [Winogradskyella sp. PAMC22761]|nr:hypothetical protein H7F37_01425 [Winogradskyella sp. PAMC22761]QNK78177.1 hypothetical protein H7F37_03585 [Winogradskyella sp. PAMC22761]
MRKNQILLCFLIILQSCQSDLLIDNKPIIDKIDKLKFSKTTFEVSIDDNENIIDTLSIEKIKTGENEIVLYKWKEYKNKYGKTTKQTYYRNNEDLFYQLTDFGTGDWKLEYETFVNKDNVIDKAQMVNIESKSSDTIFMKYSYSFDSKGKKETLSITSVSASDSINSVSFTKFNDDEKSEFGFQIVDNDTLEKSRMKYLNGNIIESTHEFKEPFKINRYDYDSNKNLKSSTTFKKVNDSLIKSSEYIYEYSNPDNLERIIIKDFENDTIMKRKIITAHNTVYN